MPLAITPTFSPWTHTSDDIYIYHLSLVLATATVSYDTSTRCTYSSLETLVPGAAYLVPGTVHAITQETMIQITGTGVCLARKISLSAGTTSLHVRATSRATPFSCDGGEGEAQFPHGAWTNCEAPPCVQSAVHVMLEKRGGPFRTD